MTFVHNALAFLLDYVRREPGEALLVAGCAYLLLFTLALVALFRTASIGRRLRRIGAVNGEDFEHLLAQQTRDAALLQSEVERTGQANAQNAIALQSCFQKSALVRYDALPGVGGEQSFSLALLDAGGNGIVLTGLHNRHDMRVYAKPVAAGVSLFALSDEEREAISSARPGAIETTSAPRSLAGRGFRR